ncbi:MAG: CcdB family protein [Janthinobacterium lividum]
MVIIVQADAIAVYETRTVIPLIPADGDPTGLSRMKPSLTVAREVRRLATHLISGVPGKALSAPIASLAHERLKIRPALDLLLNGS